MKTKYYWKAVDKTDKPGTFASFIVSKGKYHLTYKIGEITKSPIPETGIFVFKTRNQAREFKHIAIGASKASTVIKVIPAGFEIKNPVYYDTWGLEYETKTTVEEPRFPNGTVTFDSVKVVGR